MTYRALSSRQSQKVSSSKKMMGHKEEHFREVQPYMKGKSVEKISVAFRFRCETVQGIRATPRTSTGGCCVLPRVPGYGDRDPEPLFSVPQMGEYQEWAGTIKDGIHGSFLPKTPARKNEQKDWLKGIRTSLQ